MILVPQHQQKDPQPALIYICQECELITYTLPIGAFQGHCFNQGAHKQFCENCTPPDCSKMMLVVLAILYWTFNFFF